MIGNCIEPTPVGGRVDSEKYWQTVAAEARGGPHQGLFVQAVISPLRAVLGLNLGAVLTPDVAAAIEVAAKRNAPAQYCPPFLDPDTGKFLIASHSPEEVRAWIQGVTQELIAAGGQQDFSNQLKHSFLDGMYLREMFIPKGTLLIGKVHRVACMNLVTKGDISILTEHGSARVRAGHTAISQPGTQKVGFAHEDTVFVNVFRTDETRLDVLEDLLALPPDTPIIAGEPAGSIE